MRHPVLTGAALLILLTGGAAWSQGVTAEQVLSQARAASYQIREGRYDLAPVSQASLEAAAKAEPANARLWTALGVAEFQMATAASQPGSDRAQLFAAVQRGAAAFEKAAALDPKSAPALSGRGTTRLLLGSFQGNVPQIMSGLADMNAAVVMAPDVTLVRLNRAFFGLNTPPQVRDAKAIEADLIYLQAVGNAREGDVLHLLLGDLYSETGRTSLAKGEYLAADRAGSTVTETAKARLTGLASDGVPASEITSLRSQLGSNCMMCHAR